MADHSSFFDAVGICFALEKEKIWERYFLEKSRR